VEQNDNVAPFRRTRNNKRPEQLRELFREAFGDARNLQGVFENLHKYRGPVESEPFRAWADRWVRWEQRRAIWLQATLAEHKRLILKTAAIALRKSFAEDCSISPEDIFIEISMLIWDRARSFMKSTQKTRPKLSTRIVGLVRFHVWTQVLKPRWRDYAAVYEQVEAGLPLGVEAFSDEELQEAAMLEAEAERVA
jgi:hypothetical protein